MPPNAERQKRIGELRAELESVEREYDRIENMGSMADLEHRLASQISGLSQQIHQLEELEKAADEPASPQ